MTALVPESTVVRGELGRLALKLFVGGIAFGVFAATAGITARGLEMTDALITRQMCAWVTMASTVPGIVAFAEWRHRRRGRNRAIEFLAHAAAFVAVCVGHALLYNFALWMFFGPRQVEWLEQVINVARYDVLIYLLVVMAVSMTRQRRVTRRGELATVRLSRRVAQAELDEMRLRLDPDAVIDELTAIASEMSHDAGGAEQRLHALSRSLREKLQRIAPRTPRISNKRLTPPPPPLNLAGKVFLIATAFGFYLATIVLVQRIAYGATTWIDQLGTVTAFLVSGVCAAAAIPVYRRSFTWRAPTLARKVLGVVIIVVVVFVQAATIESLMAWLEPMGVGRIFGATFDFVLILSIITLYLVAFDDLKLLHRESRLRSARLGAALAEARVRSLKTQLAPHFLFNALNSVMSLLASDVAGAQQMLVRLRSLLRVSTDHRSRQEVTLREDLEMTRSYLDIEKVRFRDAIDVHVDVDEQLLDAYVPSFLLQPLVENAVRHGALASVGRGTVRVCVARDNGSLAISVRNDGELLDPSSWREGIGLASTRARLAQIYGPGHELAIDVSEEHGVCVSVRIPLRVDNERA